MNRENINKNNDAGSAHSKYLDPVCIYLVSSMATKRILENLLNDFTSQTDIGIEFSAMGGVDAASEVKSSGKFNVVILSKDSIEQLIQSGDVLPDIVDFAVSEVAVAVKSGQTLPDLSSEQALKKAVLGASSIAYSTGPSGRALKALFERWGITEQIKDRLVCPPPGIPVGSLIAAGEVELGFQQKSELIHIDGIDVAGPLPAEIQINTTFTAGICQGAQCLSEIKQLFDFLCSPQADTAKQRQGMQPA